MSLVSEREIEKLKAIGLVQRLEDVVGPSDPQERVRWLARPRPIRQHDPGTWDGLKEWAQSPEGLKATMAAKVRWLCAHKELGYGLTVGGGRAIAARFVATYNNSDGYSPDYYKQVATAPCDSPEAAVDALFWKVP